MLWNDNSDSRIKIDVHGVYFFPFTNHLSVFRTFYLFFLSEIEKISMNIQKIQDGNAFANNFSIFAILSLMFIVEFLLAEYFLGRQREHQYKLQ